VDKTRDEILVSLGGLEFCEEICVIVCACRPNDFEDSLANAVTDPVVAHVDGLRATELDGVVGDSNRCAVVAIDLGGLLGVSEASEDNTFEVGMLGVDVEGGILGLRSGAADSWDGAADWEDGAIQDCQIVVGVAAEVEAASDRPCLLLGEV
jgi:hypothetical protein